MSREGERKPEKLSTKDLEKFKNIPIRAIDLIRYPQFLAFLTTPLENYLHLEVDIFLLLNL